jgi:hypothetical protein
MRDVVLVSKVLLALFICASAFAIAAEPEDEFGVLYNCNYSTTVKLDGDFAEWPANVAWHKVKHSMGWNTPKDDEDGSLEFACVADDKYLYVAVKIWDDEKCVDEDKGDSVYKDDSIELYVDGDNSKSNEYEADCSQITIGRYNIGEDPEDPMLNGYRGGSGNGTPANQSGTKAAVVDTNYGWAVEAALPFKTWNIELADGAAIGFNVQLNDDDDGVDRDHKLSWSEKEREGGETAYLNPAVFGELVFIKDLLAVSSEGKLAATWGLIKVE